MSSSVGNAERGTALRAVAPGLWIAERPLKLPLRLGNLPCHMTIIRLTDGALFLHSPVLLDASIHAALGDLGPVGAIVAPSKAHHLFVADYVQAYPQARLYGAPGLAEKRRDLNFLSLVDDWPYPVWRGQIERYLFRGAPILNEVVFFHPVTRTLILTDLICNLTREQAAQARLFHWLTGASGRFGPHRLIRRMISDRSAARNSVETILRWDFDRVIVAHGELSDVDCRVRVHAAFSFLWR